MVLFEQAVQQWAYMTQDVGAFLDVHACESLACASHIWNVRLWLLGLVHRDHTSSHGSEGSSTIIAALGESAEEALSAVSTEVPPSSAVHSAADPE